MSIFLLQLRTLNAVANWDELQETVQNKITEYSNEYGAHAQIVTQELGQDLDKIRRQKQNDTCLTNSVCRKPWGCQLWGAT